MINFLVEKRKFCDLVLGSFLNKIPKEKISNLYFKKVMNICSSKDTLKKLKMQATDLKKIFAVYKFDNQLVSRIYKGLLQIWGWGEAIQLFSDGQKYFIEEDIQMVRASLVAQLVKNLPAMQETWVWSLDREDPLEKEVEPTPVFLPGEFHGQRSLVGYSAWGHKELDMTE